MIKSCPFCGNVKSPKLMKNSDLGEAEKITLTFGWRVVCNYMKNGCGAQGGTRTTEKEAIEFWNKRQ